MFSPFLGDHLHVKYGKTCKIFSIDCKIIYKSCKMFYNLKVKILQKHIVAPPPHI